MLPRVLRIWVAGLLLVPVTGLHAASWHLPEGVGLYAEVGHSPRYDSRRTTAVAVGFTAEIPGFAWRGLTAHLDGFISVWSADNRAGRTDRNLTQIGQIAVLRYRFGGSPRRWFTDLGVGLTFSDRHYRTLKHAFSTRFQFTEVIALGRGFGDRRQHEVALRLQHVSNAGIRNPNPGEDFLRLRYLYRF